MVDEQVWERRRAQELQGLGQLITFADEVFPNCGVGIEGSRHYGLGLVVHGVEIARAIRLCVRKNLPGPAFALARTLYEAVLRGHVIAHEIGLPELNDLLVHTQHWQARHPTDEPPPKIELRGNRWKSVAYGTREDPDFGNWRPLESQAAMDFQDSVVDMHLLHDLTHGGMTQALQMVGRERVLGTNFSMQNQTRLLCFAERAVMFAIVSWPGAPATFEREIRQQAQRFMERIDAWEGRIQRTT